MARQRDYKAEYAKRNALAQSRGFKNYADYRKQYETGKAPAVQPKRIRKESTRKAQKNFLQRTKEVLQRGWENFSYDQIIENIRAYETDESRAVDWSAAWAQSSVAKYAPEEAQGLGLTKAGYTRAYVAAFIDGDHPGNTMRNPADSDALRYWLVNIQKYFEADEYESRYGAK